MRRRQFLRAALGTAVAVALPRHLAAQSPGAEPSEVEAALANGGVVSLRGAGLKELADALHGRRGTSRDAQQKTMAALTPVRGPAAGKSNYRITLKLLDGVHVANYSVTVKDDGDAWTVTGYWPASSNPSGEMTDVATLEKGVLLLRKEAFRRLPNQVGQTSKPVTTDLVFSGNKVSGATTSANGEATPVSIELPAPIYPGGVAIDVVIGCLPLAKGYAATYRYWNVQTLKEGALQVKVVGTERVTVPAGTFDSWKLELTTADGSERGTLWIAKDSRTPVKSSGSKTVGRGTIYSSTELVP